MANLRGRHLVRYKSACVGCDNTNNIIIFQFIDCSVVHPGQNYVRVYRDNITTILLFQCFQKLLDLDLGISRLVANAELNICVQLTDVVSHKVSFYFFD